VRPPRPAGRPAEEFGIDYVDTDHLRHIAWLAHGTLRSALSLAGQPPVDVHRPTPTSLTTTTNLPVAAPAVARRKPRCWRPDIGNGPHRYFMLTSVHQ
jgi:hypothetical protein